MLQAQNQQQGVSDEGHIQSLFAVGAHNRKPTKKDNPFRVINHDELDRQSREKKTYVQLLSGKQVNFFQGQQL